MEWSRKTSRTFKTLKWMILPMSFLGWYKDGFTKNKTRILQIFNIILFFTMFFSSCCIIVYTLYISSTNTSVNITGFISNIGNIFILIFGSLYIPPTFYKLVLSCDRLQTNVLFYSARRNINIGTLTIGITYFIFVAVMLVTSFILALEQYAYIFQNNLEAFLMAAGIFVGLVNQVLSNYQKILILSLTHCLCLILKLEVLDVTEKLKKMASTVPSKLQLEDVRRRYIDITHLIRIADDILSPLISTVLAVALLFTCFSVNNVVWKNQGTMELVSYVLFMMIDGFVVIFLLTWACILHELIASCIELPLTFDGSKMSEKVIGQSLLLIETMKNREVGLRFMKIFILNKQSVLTMIGTLVTYIIVVLQFRPE